MLFCTPPEEIAAESDLLNEQHDVRGRLRQPKAVDPAPYREALAGWRLYGSNLKKTGMPVRTDRVATANQFELVRQIIQLREILRETREEVEVLAEALEYARSICDDR